MKTIHIFFWLACFQFFSFGLFAQDSSSELIDRADFLISNDRYDEALVMLDQAIQKDASNPVIYFKKSTTYIGKGAFKEAILTLEKLVEIAPKYHLAYERLGDLYYQFRNAEKAVENYEKAFEEDEEIENKLRYKLEIISILFSTRQIADAYPHIQDAKEIMPGIFDISFFEAQFFNAIGEYEKAKEIMDPEIADIPVASGNEQYFYELGYSYHMLGDFEKADKMFENAKGGEYLSKVSQYSPDYYLSLANTYFSVYEYQESEKYLDIALKLNPNFSAAYELQKKIVSVKSPKGEMIQTVEKAMKSLSDKGKLAEKYKELSALQYQAGDYQASVISADEYLQLQPRDIQMIFLKALAEGKLSMTDQSVELLEKIVKNPSLPGDVTAQFNFALGLIFKNSGELDKADEAFKNAYGGSFKAAVSNEAQLLSIMRYRKIASEFIEGLE